MRLDRQDRQIDREEQVERDVEEERKKQGMDRSEFISHPQSDYMHHLTIFYASDTNVV